MHHTTEVAEMWIHEQWDMVAYIIDGKFQTRNIALEESQ